MYVAGFSGSSGSFGAPEEQHLAAFRKRLAGAYKDAVRLSREGQPDAAAAYHLGLRIGALQVERAYAKGGFTPADSERLAALQVLLRPYVRSFK